MYVAAVALLTLFSWILWKSSIIGTSLLRVKTVASSFTSLSDTSKAAEPAFNSMPQHTVSQRPHRMVVAMTGATGAILGIRLLEMLRELGVETHLVISKWAFETIKYETNYTTKEVQALASKCYSSHDVGAKISSGSFQTDGMVIVPCSMKTLSGVSTGYADDLIARAADFTIKEQRKLVMVVRETPLSVIHLQNMLHLAQQRVMICPPVPAYYTRPSSISDIVEQSVGRIVDALGLDTKTFERWAGMERTSERK